MSGELLQPSEREASYGRLVIVTGATASGKSHAKSILEERGIGRIVSATTRKRRRFEKGGRDYHFLSPEDFKSKIAKGHFVEWNKYNGNYYGTPKTEIEALFTGKNLVHSTEIEGAVNFLSNIEASYENTPEIAQALLSQTTLAFIGVDSLFTIRARYFQRERRGKNLTQEARETFRERLRTDWEMWNKYGHLFDHVIHNRTGEIEDTADQIHVLFDIQ